MTTPEDEEQLLKRIQPILDVANDYYDSREFHRPGEGQQILNNAIGKWGQEFLTAAVLVPIDRMRQQVQARYWDTPYLNQKIPQLGETYIDALGAVIDKFVEHFGDEIRGGVTGLLMAHYEDTRALAALMVADRAEKLSSNPIWKHFITGFIRHAFESAQGSGCKIASAYALHRFGDDSFMKPSGLEDAMSDLRRETRKAAVALGGDKEARKGASDVLEVVLRTNVIELVSLDIASFGHAFTHLPNGRPWVKGIYAK